MKEQTVYFVEGDTYSKDILPFLKDSFPSKNIISLKLDSQPDPSVSRIVFLNPTIDDRAQDFINKCAKNIKLILLLDWNHIGFNDYSNIIKNDVFYVIYSPFELCKKYRQIPSIHSSMMKASVTLGNLNTHDLFFCSQPILEDRKDIGYTQYDLIREALTLAKISKVKLFIKRHPREISAIPDDLKNEPLIFWWEESIEKALSLFKRWIGLNSIVLYDAKYLGHEVTFLKK